MVQGSSSQPTAAPHDTGLPACYKSPAGCRLMRRWHPPARGRYGIAIGGQDPPTRFSCGSQVLLSAHDYARPMRHRTHMPPALDWAGKRHPDPAPRITPNNTLFFPKRLLQARSTCTRNEQGYYYHRPGSKTQGYSGLPRDGFLIIVSCYTEV